MYVCVVLSPRGVQNILEVNAPYSCQLFAMFTFHAWAFPVYPGNSIEIILRYPGILMFAAVCVFNVSTRMSTIKKNGGRLLRYQRFLETRTQTREPSCSDSRSVSGPECLYIITLSVLFLLSIVSHALQKYYSECTNSHHYE